MEYYFGTDSCQVDIDAENLDAACVEYAEDEGIKNVKGHDDLVAYFRRVGGYMTIQEDGVEVSSVE